MAFPVSEKEIYFISKFRKSRCVVIVSNPCPIGISFQCLLSGALNVQVLYTNKKQFVGILKNFTELIKIR